MRLVNKMMEIMDMFHDVQHIRLEELNRFEDDLLFDLAVAAGTEGSYFKLSLFGESVIHGLTKACCKYGKPLSCTITDEILIDASEIQPAMVIVDFRKKKRMVFLDEVRNPDTEYKLRIHHGVDGLVATMDNIYVLENMVCCMNHSENPSIGYVVDIQTRTAKKVHLDDISWFVLPCGRSVRSEDMRMMCCASSEYFLYAEVCHMFLQNLCNKEKEDSFAMIRQITDLYQIGIQENDADMVHSMEILMNGFTAGYIHTNGRYEIPDIIQIFHAMQNTVHKTYMIHEYQNFGSYCIDMDTYDVLYYCQ